MKIKLSKVKDYGIVRFYPKCKKAKTLLEIGESPKQKRKSFTEMQVKKIEEFGIEIEYIV